MEFKAASYSSDSDWLCLNTLIHKWRGPLECWRSSGLWEAPTSGNY